MESRAMNTSAFHKLREINVNDKTEKKANLTYLSWAWAVDQLLENDPTATWEYHDPQMYGETMMVSCTVTAFGKPMREYLPVLDYKNKPIPKPDAMAVNTAMKRCLAKCIALHGLGLYIYAGEDLPPSSEAPEQTPQPSPTAQLQDDINAVDEATRKLCFAYADKWRSVFEKDAEQAYDIYRSGMAEMVSDATAQSALKGLVSADEAKAFRAIKKKRDEAAKPQLKEAA